ncbi:MAG TPA: tRNA lysidine(34) synthetase TilS [Stellaceae bacterium]|jgi:tRNA(Ile)-lysidine synthase
MTRPTALVAAAARDDSPDFAALMAPFVPFETRPHLAVAVSGGGDSMALLLLAYDWAQARGGRVTALTVDHGLRSEAAAEAAQVGAWCRARGIDQVVLRCVGLAPRSGVQAAARAARYALLETWCREHLVLHLLLAHQREDQAETVAIRASRGSALDGLAGMAAVSERGDIRLLRPLLPVSRGQLRQVLIARGQDWIEDPSNRNPAFTRVRVRAELGRAAAGSAAAHLAPTAARLGRGRAEREAEDARRLARWTVFDSAGFAWLDPGAFAGPERLGMQALGALLATVAGADYLPRRERLARLYQELVEGLAPGRTLGGCLVLARRGRILICREPAAVAAPAVLVPGMETRWDGRFAVALDRTGPAGLWVAALGREAAAVARVASAAALARIPAAARLSLPALCDAKGVVAVAALGYFEQSREEAMMAACQMQFRPTRPLTGAGFTIV